MREHEGIARLGAVVAAAALAGTVAGCGGGAKQDAKEPKGTFPVAITSASFPTKQSLSEHVTMRVAVRNEGSKAIPDVALTVETPGKGTSSGAFAEAGSSGQQLADPSRPVWIIDQGPAGGGTAYSNTWALGPLAPGKTKVFTWKVVSVKPGRHRIQYEVAAGLNGNARATLRGGGRPRGSFDIFIDRRPKQEGVDPSGRVVPLPSG